MEKTDIEWIKIPSGKFLKRKKAGNIQVYLHAFEISKYPVTNTQYKEFVDSTGYHRPGSPIFAQFELGQIELGNHPVAWINWFDAIAFCQWIGARLPTGAEWEKAASGELGFVYPWGNAWLEGYCNSLESNNIMTTPVDKYPNGVSPYGVYDMAGNIWEWTDEWLISNKVVPKLGCVGSEEVSNTKLYFQFPILRGGSVISDKFCAQAKFRYAKYRANDYGDWVGFRPVKLSS